MADDFVILVKSGRAVRRVMEGIVRYLERELKFPVNKDKSEVAKTKYVPSPFSDFRSFGERFV